MSSSLLKSISVKLITAILLIAVAVILHLYYPNDLLSNLRDQGITSILIFILLYLLGAILLFPCSFLTLVAATIWGMGKGFVIVIIASNLAAIIPFLLGRYYFRETVERLITKKNNFSAYDKAIETNAFTAVLLLRLAPLVPYNFLNYSLGVTAVGIKNYLLATFLGMIPGTLLYLYLAKFSVGLLNYSFFELGSFQQLSLIITLILLIFIFSFLSKKAKIILRIES